MIDEMSLMENLKEPNYDVTSLHWNSSHSQNEENKYCYCGGIRDVQEMDVQCNSCRNWFHMRCLEETLGPVIPFITNYLFLCVPCNWKDKGIPKESFLRTENTWPGICVTALANLTLQKSSSSEPSKSFFKKNEDLRPFVDSHWSALCTGRARTATWWATMGSCLYQHRELFVCEDESNRSSSLGFSLRFDSLMDIVPYDTFSKGSLPVSETRLAVSKESDDSRKFHDEVMSKTRGSERGDRRSESMDMAKFDSAAHDHPFNKDGFRYALAERDPFSDFSFRRKDIHSGIYISREDRSPHIIVTGDRLTATTEKGFRLARASEAIIEGSWYFEVFIHPRLSDEAHCRIGCSRQEGKL